MAGTGKAVVALAELCLCARPWCSAAWRKKVKCMLRPTLPSMTATQELVVPRSMPIISLPAERLAEELHIWYLSASWAQRLQSARLESDQG